VSKRTGNKQKKKECRARISERVVSGIGEQWWCQEIERKQASRPVRKGVDQVAINVSELGII
jgi:hypothetical protein